MYFAYFTLTSSAPSETVVQRLNREMLESSSTGAYQNYLTGVALSAATTGRNVFKMSESLSEDCVRTAKVTMDLLVKPSTWLETKSVLTTSAAKTIEDVKSGKKSVNPTELICQHLNEEFKKKISEFPAFEDLKKNIDLPKPTKNYILEVQPEQNIKQLLTQVEDLEFVKLAAILHFQGYENLGISKRYAELASIGKAIHQLSEQEKSKATVDNVFHQVLEDYIKDLRTKNENIYAKMMSDAVSPSLATKVDEYFRNDAALKEEYEKIKKEAIDHVNKIAKF